MIGPSNHTSKQLKHPSFGMATCCMELWDEYNLTIFNEKNPKVLDISRAEGTKGVSRSV